MAGFDNASMIADSSSAEFRAGMHLYVFLSWWWQTAERFDKENTSVGVGSSPMQARMQMAAHSLKQTSPRIYIEHPALLPPRACASHEDRRPS